MNGTDYEITANYTAPKLLSGVASFLSFTRFSGSTNFADLVSPDLNEQKNYTYGMVFLVTIMATILFLWASIVVVLKYNDDLFGCASGKPFQTSASASTTASHPSTQNETFESSSLESGNAHQYHEMQNSNVVQSSANSEVKSSVKDPIKAAKRRQQRTRIVFVIFGVAVLACTVLLLLFSFSSFRSTLESSDEFIVTSQDIVDQVKSTVRTVESAVQYANETLNHTSMNLQTVCPNYVDENVTGVNLNELTTIMKKEFEILEEVGIVNMTQINRTMDLVQNGLDRVRETVDTADEKMWVFPLVLLIVFVTGTAMLFGVVLAWTGKSSSRFEKKMAYGVLPIFVLLTIVCWLIALGCAIASLVTSDACASPDSTVQAILAEHNVDMNSTTAQLITVYTNGCQGEDPLEIFNEFEEELQTAIDSIWRAISIADSIGREELSRRCGNDVDDVLNGARNLARSLTWTRKALISSVLSLQCGPIHELYVQAVHQSFCTEGGEGLAWAFILFSVVGIGSMVMVSLRASLYNHKAEEEVYHEDDEADNMILNEHEEYLAYISKYKHEWEEYQGMDAAEPFDETGASGDADESIESIVASESWTERGDDDTGIEGDSWDADTDPPLSPSDSEEYGSIESCPTDDISFPSLGGSQRSSMDQGGCSSPAIPSILGPRKGDSDEAWDQEPDFFLGDKNTQVTAAAPSNELEEPNVEAQLSPSFAMACTAATAIPSDDNAVGKKDPPVQEVGFHNSLCHVQSPVSEHSAGRRESDWCTAAPKSVIDTGVESNGKETEVPDKYSTPTEKKEGKFDFLKHVAAVVTTYEL